MSGRICGDCSNWRCDNILRMTGHCIISRIDKFHGTPCDTCTKYQRRTERRCSMNLYNDDFGILAVCAIRYCQGRQTYMPELVRRIVRAHISEVTDHDLQVMVNDCESQYAFGNENIDKPGWIEWKDFLINEQERRRSEQKVDGNSSKLH